MSMENIRNFCIIAHIDHGKSTLADRLLQMTGTVDERQLQEQTLDDMDIERERGITIKSHAIQMRYSQGGQDYVLNLIDTPGHVDFSYEVSRSIAACEGALLIVDATQGIEAQTISNLYLAIEHDLEIIPVLNKMDLPSADPEEVIDQIVDLIGCDPEDVLPASGKTGLGVEKILEAVVERVPAPKGDTNAPFQAMVFDSVFNPFRGIIAYYRVLNGEIKKGERVRFFNTGKEYNAEEIGVLGMDLQPEKTVKAGNVGYIISGIKNAKEVKVGDTLTLATNPCEKAVKGFEDVKPMVFAGIYPVDTEDYEELRYSMEKAPVKRRVIGVRAGELGRPWLWFPLRIPRHAPHGNRAGAVGAGVQHDGHHHGAQRELHLPPQKGRAHLHLTIPQSSRTPAS